MRERMNPSPGWGGFALNPTKPCSCGQLSCSCRSWKLQKLLPAGISAVARDTGWGRWVSCWMQERQAMDRRRRGGDAFPPEVLCCAVWSLAEPHSPGMGAPKSPPHKDNQQEHCHDPAAPIPWLRHFPPQQQGITLGNANKSRTLHPSPQLWPKSVPAQAAKPSIQKAF